MVNLLIYLDVVCLLLGDSIEQNFILITDNG